MKDFQETVNTKISEMVEDGSIERKIQEQVEKAIEKAIENQFGYHGEIKAQIEKAVKEGLKIDMRAIDFDSYNQQMLAMFRVKLGNMFHGQAYEHFMSQIDELLQPAPEAMSLDDLLTEIARQWREYSWGDVDDFMFVEINEDEHIDGAWSVRIRKKEEKDYLADKMEIRLYINPHGVLKINHCHKYNPTCFDGAEALVFKLYSAGTQITGVEECDPDALELHLRDIDHY